MSQPANTMSGGEAMIRAARANGINTIFGIPGAQIYPLFDAMQRLGITTITTRHEQGAAYMAMGYAKALGQPGALAVVPGPGVLNTTAALCTAMGTCTPLLCLTGQVPSAYLGKGRGHLHELADQSATLQSLIKDAIHIDDPAQTSAIINRAFATMLSGRPGPVAVDMCWDTMAESAPLAITAPPASPVTQPELDQDAVNHAAAILAKARKPMIMCGAGAQHAAEAVGALADVLQAPVTAFRSGRGVVAEDNPLGVSSVAAYELFKDVDVLIGVGSRLEMIYMRWRSMMAYQAKPENGPTLIRIDIDPAEMQRLQPDVAIVADSHTACTALVNALTNKVSPDSGRVQDIAAAKAHAARAIAKVQPQMSYLQVIREVLPRDGFYVPELSQMGFTSYYGLPIYTPRTYVTEGHQGTLGFGFQTALGVKVAQPDRAVVSVTGDGGFMFGLAELATAVQYNIAVVTLIFNNGTFANVRRDQQQQYQGRLNGADFDNPDFVALAESFGATALRVNSPQALRPALARALAAGRPTVIDIQIDKDSETSPWEFIHR